jgi:hypothetical protein
MMVAQGATPPSALRPSLAVAPRPEHRPTWRAAPAAAFPAKAARGTRRVGAPRRRRADLCLPPLDGGYGVGQHLTRPAAPAPPRNDRPHHGPSRGAKRDVLRVG